MADGFQVDPASLRGASRDVYAGSDAVGDAARRCRPRSWWPAALGEVPAADELARAFATFAGEHGEDLRRGASWVTDAADGLVSSADDYERRDENAASDVTAAGA